jgi:retron-type reverse transcriptase
MERIVRPVRHSATMLTMSLNDHHHSFRQAFTDSHTVEGMYVLTYTHQPNKRENLKKKRENNSFETWKFHNKFYILHVIFSCSK